MKPTHLSLFTGIGGIDCLFYKVPVINAKSNYAGVKQLTCKVFQFAVDFPMLILRTNNKIFRAVVRSYKINMVNTFSFIVQFGAISRFQSYHNMFKNISVFTGVRMLRQSNHIVPLGLVGFIWMPSFLHLFLTALSDTP